MAEISSTSSAQECPPPSRIGKDPIKHWTYDPSTGLIDMSRPGSDGSKAGTRPLVTIQTTTNPVRLDPKSTALIIIDMQNFFLSPALRGGNHSNPAAAPAPSPGITAANTLLSTGIPAARKHGIQVCWVNWGLTEEEISTMPPGMVRAFGVYDPVCSIDAAVSSATQNGDSMIGTEVPGAVTTTVPKRKKNPALYRGLGADLGPIDIGSGQTVDGGRILMRNTWNAGLYPPLDEEYRRGKEDASIERPDVWIHKNRMSGLWGPRTDLEEFLDRENITTLLFAGVNTDQCVGSTLVDAFSKGYDCILLKDAAATGSPAFAQEAWEWNCGGCWGFVTDCKALRDAEILWA